MGTRDDRVDAYIAKSADFARPILTHLREVVHAACPDVEETMKWSFPHFQYKGMLCSMASFKEHCAFGFWKGSLIVEKGDESTEQAMGQFGRITKLSDLPSKKVLTGYIKQAMKLNDDGREVARPGRSRRHRGSSSSPTTWPPPSRPTRRPRPPSRSSAPATSASTSTGSPRPRPRPPAPAAASRPSSGWPRASRGTGST